MTSCYFMAYNFGKPPSRYHTVMGIIFLCQNEMRSANVILLLCQQFYTKLEKPYSGVFPYVFHKHHKYWFFMFFCPLLLLWLIRFNVFWNLTAQQNGLGLCIFVFHAGGLNVEGEADNWDFGVGKHRKSMF